MSVPLPDKVVVAPLPDKVVVQEGTSTLTSEKVANVHPDATLPENGETDGKSIIMHNRRGNEDQIIPIFTTGRHQGRSFHYVAEHDPLFYWHARYQGNIADSMDMRALWQAFVMWTEDNY